MKTSLPMILSLLAVAAGCSLWETPPFPGRFRLNTLDSRTSPYIQRDSGGKDILEEDESLFSVCGVRVPDGYDWQKDSAGGLAECELVLLRDTVEILSLRTGVQTRISTEPDSHHLIDGHLYTEYSDAVSTSVLRDGEEVLRFNGREKMRGILPSRDGHLITLGAERDGQGFCLRKDGEILIRNAEGYVCGDFGQGPYYSTGALYENEGHYYFSYLLINGMNRMYYDVCDAVSREMDWLGTGSSLIAFRHVGGKDVAAWTDESQTNLKIGENSYSVNRKRYFLETATVIPEGPSGCCIAGQFRDFSGKAVPYRFTPSGISIYSSRGGLWQFSGGTFVLSVHQAADSTVYVYHSDGRSVSLVRDAFIWEESCACMQDGGIAMAMNRRTKGKRPFIWYRSKVTEMDFEGYLTGICPIVSPPS